MRVLVADDDPDALLTLSVLLVDDGHQVEKVGRGPDVLQAVRAFRPEAVLLDIKMPGMSGYDLARAIRERYGQARPLMIAISGHYRQGIDKLLAKVVGFDHYFAKPYDPAALLWLLRD
jgi:CheY-like chemotaxis protein